ncbi:MAG: 2-dehydropantoate 2-reductase [Archangium sp.]
MPSDQKLHIGVFGAGAIGCYVGARLLASSDARVTFVGRERLRDELARTGLAVQDFDGPREVIEPSRFTFATDASALKDCSVVLCCVKSQHSEDAGRSLSAVLQDGATVVSLQNGVRNPATLRALLPKQKVLASIVTWNVIQVEGTFRRATSGPLIIETPPPELDAALRAAKIPLEVSANLTGDQWTKLIVNLNNAVSALTDVSTGTLLLDAGYRRIVRAVVSEGVRVVKAAGIELAPWNGAPIGLMPKVLALPTFLVKLITRRQLKVDPAARSSMWQDLDARRTTEIDYLNGEVVSLAAKHGTTAPVNTRIVELIRVAEKAKAGSPRMSSEALWRALSTRD